MGTINEKYICTGKIDQGDKKFKRGEVYSGKFLKKMITAKAVIIESEWKKLSEKDK